MKTGGAQLANVKRAAEDRDSPTDGGSGCAYAGRMNHRTLWAGLTLLLAALLAAAAAVGVFVPDAYALEHPNWAAQGIGQDAVDLFLVVPALLLCAWRIGRGSQNAAAVWQGLLLYIAYSYTLYSFFLHFGRFFLLYVALLGLSVHLLVASATSAANVRGVAPTRTQARLAGALLALSATLFALLWLREIVPAMATGVTPKSVLDVGMIVNPVHVLDLALVLPAMLLTAALLWRGHPRGGRYVVPLLVFMAAMGCALLGMSVAQHLRGFPLFPPPLVVMGLIVLASTATATWLLRGPTR